MAAADDPAAAAAAASSSAGHEDDEGTDTDGSNSDRAAVQDPDPQLLPDDAAPAPPPPPVAAPEATGAVPPPPPQTAATDDSRRLFQRLWTDEEELLILRGFLDFTARRGTTFASHQYDTGPFYEEIRRRLSFEFTKSQLIEKLPPPQEEVPAPAPEKHGAQGAAFARDGNGAGGDASDEDDINPAAAAAAGAVPGAAEDGAGGGSASAHTPRGRGARRVKRKTAQEMEANALPTTTSPLIVNDVARQPLVVAVENLTPAIAQLPPVVAPSPAPAIANGATEEAVRAILSPLLREVISSITVAGQTGLGLGLNMGFGGIGGVDILGLGLGVASSSPVVSGDEKWRQQQILELEVYLKRIELVREQVTAALEELRSSEG
ncbi:hypothetical protein PR202_gb26795 [Eleusine coracana subsp. coracana]|uniref:Glabrous enhancer-binding protein-like DBD domain-containing protein n=1 Tax=Eleusine coracana subsp. coracana TaxID=191504 RepID=A0AAV5FSU6_ELECO|nr:hypothetical protein PR202_gb26795 [Eleusine coracana subsp. coracana]